jgi:hypothetical protein
MQTYVWVRRRLGWAGHVVRMREVRNANVCLVGKLNRRDLSVDGRIILHWILVK